MFSAGVPTPALFASDGDAKLLIKAAEIADTSAGFTAPHPNSACLLFNGTDIVGRGVLYGQGTTSAEVQACRSAGELANGCTAYLNLEPGDCHGDDSAIFSLKQLDLQLGQFVLLKFAKARLKKYASHKGKVVKLSNKYGPFKITDQVNDATFRLDFPPSWKIHNAFHVSLLRPYMGPPPSEPVTDELPEIEEMEEI
ncbi:hypothetical protein L7F22_061176 [Adiantum nelumboides]|nr:hypothetical protein [Adiantum nelumboides]